MGRDPTFSREMREAIVHAAVDRGYSASEVAELARDGRLEGLPPFEVAPSTVNDLAGRARRERGAEPPASDPTADRMRRVAEQTIERVERLDGPGAKDLSALREAHRVLEQLDRAERRRAPPVALINPRHRPSASESDLVERMQADIDADLRAVAAGAPCSHVVSSSDRNHCVSCCRQREDWDDPSAVPKPAPERNLP